MSRITEIISRARDTLADPNSDRWDDPRLLRLVSEAQEDIVIHTELLKSRIDIPLVVGQAEYDLPADCYRIIRAAVDNREIPLLTNTIMDENARRLVYADNVQDYFERDSDSFNVRTSFDSRSLKWEDATGGEVEAVIFDNRNPLKIQFYPIPDDTVSDSDYTFQNANTVTYVGDEMLGLVTDIETTDLPNYTFDSPYGVLTSMFDPLVTTEVMESIYGIVVQIMETDGMVSIWYTSTALILSSTADQLLIPTMYDKALKYYVIAHAYDDDYDTASLKKSAKFLKLYEREFDLARKFSATDGIKSPSHRSHYRSPWE